MTTAGTCRVLGSFVLTAALILGSVGVANAAKPGGGGGTDPCIGAQSRGFPALVFMRQSGTYWNTVLADSSGTCERIIYSYTGSAYGRDVNLRFDPTSGHGITVRGGPSFTQFASTFDVAFDAGGAPNVQSSAYVPILAMSDLPLPADLVSAGWSPAAMGNMFLSHDGRAVLVTMSMNGPASQQPLQVLWTCPFDASTLTVDKASCRDLYRKIYASGFMAGWSVRSDAVLLLDVAVSGSGYALYRLKPSDGSLSQLWSRGTLLSGVKARLDGSGHEQAAIYEPGSASGCQHVVVIDVDSCADNSCQILNGAGNPARMVTWLPDGRVAGEGQTAPSRRGQCSASGSIVSFSPTDLTGTATTLISSGLLPDGAGGG